MMSLFFKCIHHEDYVLKYLPFLTLSFMSILVIKKLRKNIDRRLSDKNRKYNKM